MHAIVLAGGIGARLWPLSRELYPKQFHKFNGEHTLLQDTLLRISPVVPFNNMIVVTNNAHSLNIRMQAAQVSGSEAVKIIQEPEGKNTAPAIALGLLYLQKGGHEGEVVVVLPSDHIIEKREEFQKLLKAGEEVAREGYLVTFGIEPDRPETGYGYIKRSNLEVGANAYKVERFVEKPDLDTAQEYLRQGGYFWNSGIFMFKVATVLEEYHKLLLGICNVINKIDFDNNNLGEIYVNLESISIDYGIMERSDKVAVIPASMGWNDIGSWQFLYRSLPKDDRGNVLQGKVLSLESQSNLVLSEKKLTAVVGLESMIVVNTDDALLVCPQESAQDVKKVVDILKEQGADEYQIHTTVEKPWGYYTVLEKGPRYKIKRVVVHPGHRLSMQMHYHRSEHWVVVAGTAKIVNGEREFYLHTNESTYIPMSTKHRLGVHFKI